MTGTIGTIKKKVKPSGVNYYFVTYGINARGAFETIEEAQYWASKMKPIKINGYNVKPEVIPLDASIYDGVAYATKRYAQAPLGSIILYEGEEID